MPTANEIFRKGWIEENRTKHGRFSFIPSIHQVIALLIVGFIFAAAVLPVPEWVGNIATGLTFVVIGWMIFLIFAHIVNRLWRCIVLFMLNDQILGKDKAARDNWKKNRKWIANSFVPLRKIKIFSPLIIINCVLLMASGWLGIVAAIVLITYHIVNVMGTAIVMGAAQTAMTKFITPETVGWLEPADDTVKEEIIEEHERNVKAISELMDKKKK